MIKKNLIIIILIFIIFSHCSKNNPAEPGINIPIPTGIEQQVFNLINQHRVSIGLSEFVWNDIIANQCRNHSQNMADGSVPFGHEGFSERVDTIRNHINLSTAAENVACNVGYSDPASIAVNGWLNSQGHRENIEGDYNLTGVGISVASDSTYYFTQIFINER